MTSGKRVGKDLYCKLTDIKCKRKGGEKALIDGSASNCSRQETSAGPVCTFQAGPWECPTTALNTALGTWSVVTPQPGCRVRTESKARGSR